MNKEQQKGIRRLFEKVSAYTEVGKVAGPQQRENWWGALDGLMQPRSTRGPMKTEILVVLEWHLGAYVPGLSALNQQDPSYGRETREKAEAAATELAALMQPYREFVAAYDACVQDGGVSFGDEMVAMLEARARLDADGDSGGGWIDKPEEMGWYWFKPENYGGKALPLRIIKVWGYKDSDDGRRFTNEDGGAQVCDQMYRRGQWRGPIPTPPQVGERNDT